MKLLGQFLHKFESAVRQRGAEYYRQNRVLIDSTSNERLMATVRGSTGYQIELERQGSHICASCSCPYFHTGLCKHIFSVLMAADLRHIWQDIVFKSLNRKDEERTRSPRETPMQAPAAGKATDWRSQMARLSSEEVLLSPTAQEGGSAKRELLYVIDVQASREGAGLYLEVFHRDRKKNGTWSQPKIHNLRAHSLRQLPDSQDRQILGSLRGANQVYAPYGFSGSYSDMESYPGMLPTRYRLSSPQLESILPTICRTGRARLRLNSADEESQWLVISWDEGEPWNFRLEVHRAQPQRYEAMGVLRREAERLSLDEPLLLAEEGVFFTREAAARYDHHGAFKWVRMFRKSSPLVIPVGQGEEFVQEFLRQSPLPPIDLPPELHYEETYPQPKPRLTVTPDKSVGRTQYLCAEFSFDYDGLVISQREHKSGIFQQAKRRMIWRNFSQERALTDRAKDLGMRFTVFANRQNGFEFKAKLLPQMVRQLTADGWHIEADGKAYRSAGRFDLKVTTGIDWFELHGVVEFGDARVQFPRLLAALRRGEMFVKLDDGTFGLLPEEWLQQYGALASLGAQHADHLRFKRSQVGFLDALLAAQPEAQCDAVFIRLRDELKGFSGIRPLEPPRGFQGELRPYQKEGLGWLEFLRQFGFGGCLADDMGLGKTVQVLAMLEARRARRNTAPSLVVVPRSLIFNWQREAARFTPRLRTLDHTGHERLKGKKHFEAYDLILTTYGTLRNDIVNLKEVRFDYVILDEAQAIKNASSESAKAARLLNAEHRLAMSGTPIENHLGELWSLFEFLNPGMLGAASVFKSTAGAENPDEATRQRLVHALRPFLLRRTKEQVVKDLPLKVEQTLYCELETRQRKLYEELRAHYRLTLLGKVEEAGLARSKMQILEALLRLRQAALHPGLLDPARLQEPSAKLDMLLPQLQEVIEEGHKVLVFSQFTGMLHIVRQHLDREGVRYEYLDGQTVDRESCVGRFQTDPACKLFLISLKAGGVGLNLTAAEYVFLLDPWWNPAVEAQAIDRAHRIGQTKRVFAYRLIARGTVEEKVLELQNTKRSLADAIMNADNALIRDLSRQDLELLLS